MRNQSSSVTLILKIAIMLTIGISLFIYTKLGQRIEASIYDKLLQVKDRKASPDITIVELDQKTLKYIDTPNDDIHAQFIKKLFYLAPHAVIIDKSLSLNLDEEAILKSITSIQNLYLPVHNIQNANLDLLDEYFPSSSHTERLIKNAGHFLFNVDSDARIRSINLNVKMFKIQGVNERPESHKPSIKNDEQVPYAIFNAYHKSTIIDNSFLNKLRGLTRFLIPYHSQKYNKVSYIDVLRNEVDISLITGKYIIIGQNIDSTTLYNTPYGMATSLDIHAQALQGFLDQQIIKKVSAIAEYIIAIVTIIISILIIWACMPKVALTFNILLIVLIIFINIIAFYYNIWFSPLPSILAVIAAYPLWSHYRMLHMTKFIDHELRAINPSSLNLLRSLNQGMYNNKPASMWFQQDAFSQHIAQFRAMIANHENMRQFIINNMNAMPDVIMVTNLQGDIIVDNHSAEIWLSKLAMTNQRNLPYLFHHLANHQQIQPKMFWRDILDDVKNNPKTWHRGVDIQLNIGPFRHMLLKIMPSNSTAGNMISWLWVIQDLSEKKQMEQQHDEMMRFLSHDMRAPQSAIIANIEMYRQEPNPKPEQSAVLLKKIESNAHRTLTLAEEFVQLAKAEGQDYQKEHINITNLVMDVIDDMWVLAKQKNIKINQEFSDDEYVLGDRSLLSRCVTNLLNNAIKYTPENRQIWIKSSKKGSNFLLRIIDEGIGISQENQKKLFKRFTRFKETEHIDGVGLGLSFVKVVVDKHQGHIACSSEYGKGCQFTLSLPIIVSDIKHNIEQQKQDNINNNKDV